ncbi:metal-dependent transcriptional regulator [Thermoproteus tenax]|uniref:Manganese-dependent transcriptional regulator n=1 Tax=Thermoproteus tenax (strain ATCC 35583 / DSM 2078 / JCM 9277 / NBRC 100435 / Kra 1) TaxID=768679 RepID=G4RPS5_THETK|nr:metal-dependent transcriptional regulator [Thermoproteus tenax]CCC81570.1 manganese-dependent transcriptional regulator [Thermoproteus tenax Kra 1]
MNKTVEGIVGEVMRKGHEIKDVRPEHYLEAIYELSSRGRVTLSDLARMLGVKPSSAQKMVKRLEEQGLVVYKGRGGITITERGLDVIAALERSHKTLAEFFKLIGVEEELAEVEAEKLEHLIDPRVVERISYLVHSLRYLKKLYEK